MMKLSVVLLVAVPAAASADAFTTWKVPDGVSLSPKKCTTDKDVTECLHLGWAAEAGSRGFDQAEHDRLVSAHGWYVRACELAKKTPCANADRMQKKIDKVDGLKTDADKGRFYCADALDGAKLWAKPGASAAGVVIRGCLDPFPEAFRDGLGGLGKKSKSQRQHQVLQAALDHLCPTLPSKPTDCASKSAKVVPAAKQRAAAGRILGDVLGGELAKRGPELDGWLIAD